MAIKVNAYDIGWNPVKQVGLVKLTLSNGNKPQFAISGLTELGGWMALLRKEPLFVSVDGYIHTGPEAVGEAFDQGTEV
jgi:hypothetical protein